MMFNAALRLFVLFSPILFLPLSIPCVASFQFYRFGYFSTSINLVQLQLFEYASILLFMVALTERPRQFFQNKALACSIFFIFLNTLLNPIKVKTIIPILCGILLYYVVCSYTDVRNVKRIFKIIVLVSFINSLFAILQFCGIHLIYNKSSLQSLEVFGLMSYKTQMGIYQAVAMPLAFYLHPVLALVPLVGLILAKSGTAFFSAILGMIFLIKNKIKIDSPILWLSFITGIGLFILKYVHKLKFRFEVWIEALKQIIEKPLGHGFGEYTYTLSDNVPLWATKITDTYNIYLQVAHALGIFGLIVFIYFIVNKFLHFPFDDFMARSLFSACLIFLISGFFYCFMDYARLSGTAIVLFGLLFVVKQKGEENVNKV